MAEPLGGVGGWFVRFGRMISTGLVMLGLGAGAAGCAQTIAQPPIEPRLIGTVTLTPFLPQNFTLTPAAGLMLTATPTPAPTLAPGGPVQPELWVGPEVPVGLANQLTLPRGWGWGSQPEKAALRLEPGGTGTVWTYVLGAPFAEVSDEIGMDDLARAWTGERLGQANDQALLVTESTLQAVTYLLGAPGEGAVRVVDSAALLDLAWQLHSWAILPFEELEPRWKVIRVDGKSPLARGELGDYPLVVPFRLRGTAAALGQFAADGGSIPAQNRDPAKMTTLLMTGTTALVRAVGYKMEVNGMTYPGEDIRTWMEDADFTHVSNESSFNPACPNANPNQTSLMFCSKPEYIELLDSVGVDVVELSGNHNNDWGRDAFNYSLDLFRERGWKWFAGGANAEEARAPLLLEHNGNQIALIGCNYAGPEGVWATRDEPGAAHCNLDWLEGELARLKSEGILPVVTFQYNEIYQMKPSEGQVRDFNRAADAGAVIVSGSQAHFPQTFEFVGGTFIHYGLGNLFFDQMDTPVDGTRRELLDLHVIYNGRHISTVELTAMLEDYSRPRPMTAEERTQFLSDLFAAAGW